MFSCSILKRSVLQNRVFVRYNRKPDHWSVLIKKNHPVDKALAHFDDFYKQVFTKNWPSIRKGLLGEQKYVAIVNSYSDSEETMAKLELTGAVNMRALFKVEKERIQEELNENKRKNSLNKIWAMEEKLDAQQEQQKSVEKPKQTVDLKQFSLEKSLETAEYDARRLIDTKNTISSEILHEFIPATKIKGMEDYLMESDHYKLYDNSSKFTVNVEREYDIHFPEHLNVYCYEEENNTRFEPSLKGSTGVLNFYLMDGGSVLPVLALDLKPNNTILDVCASPGGKSLLALQTLYPKCVVSNDISHSRVNRIEDVYKQFLYDFKDRWLKTERVKLSNRDGRNIVEDDNFDRILVDVPCTVDRHSLKENDNNIFKPSRIKERLKLPELQSELLVQALKLVRKNGIVVYSTCSLSPIQNDGVVHMALKKVWEETRMEFVVKDLSPALLQARNIYQLADKQLLRYGHLVLPNIAKNYGPTYFCKIKKIK